MEGVKGWTGNESRLIGNPEVTDRIEAVCEDNSLFGVSESLMEYIRRILNRSNRWSDSNFWIAGMGRTAAYPVAKSDLEDRSIFLC